MAGKEGKGGENEEGGKKVRKPLQEGQFYKEPRPLAEMIADAERALAQRDAINRRLDAVCTEPVAVNDHMVKFLIMSSSQPVTILGNYLEAHVAGRLELLGNDFWTLVDDLKLGDLETMINSYGGGRKKYKLDLKDAKTIELVERINALLGDILTAIRGRDLQKLEASQKALKVVWDSVNPLAGWSE